jgi:hypothetical protein
MLSANVRFWGVKRTLRPSCSRANLKVLVAVSQLDRKRRHIFAPASTFNLLSGGANAAAG